MRKRGDKKGINANKKIYPSFLWVKRFASTGPS
jgi:hypothetical protein